MDRLHFDWADIFLWFHREKVLACSIESGPYVTVKPKKTAGGSPRCRLLHEAQTSVSSAPSESSAVKNCGALAEPVS